MEDDRVRIVGAERSARPRSRLGPAAIVVAVLVMGAVLVFGPGATESPGPQSTVATVPPALNDVFIAPEQAEALSLVRDLEAALAAGDGMAFERLVSVGYHHLEIPGSSTALFPDQGSLVGRSRFVAEVASVDLGPCEPEPAAEQGDIAVVCREVSVSGAYPEALHRAGGGQRVTFVVRDGGIYSMFWGLHHGSRADVEGYCVYALATFPDLASAAFDNRCTPIETAATASVHAEIATGYVSERRSRITPAEAAGKRAPAIVDGFLRELSSGGDPMGYVSRDFRVVRFPGLLQGIDQPPFSDFSAVLAWIGVAYDVRLVGCSYEQRSSPWPIRASCTTEWSGSLVAAAGPESITVPMDFWLSGFEIVGFGGETPPVLAAAGVDLCGWGRGAMPVEAAAAFREDCVPVHTVAAATVLTAIAERYPGATALGSTG